MLDLEKAKAGSYSRAAQVAVRVLSSVGSVWTYDVIMDIVGDS